MKVDVLARWTGNIQFTAEIECEENAANSVKLGLAVRWGKDNDANLSGADLSDADLSGADLSGADLRDANLSGADLSDANLSDADLSGADLSGADLRDANLRDANLSGANLSDANLRDADLRDANLRDANLSGANLSDANLRDADLCDANLRDADLSGADLRGADLSGADLRDADLRGADLRHAGGVVPELVQPLLILLEQPGKIRAYKLVNKDNTGPYHPGISYIPGKSVSEGLASVDVSEDCASGISVATLDWCLRNWHKDYKILIVEFEAADIAAIPTAGNGKFRLFRCDVVSEKELDYKALGLLKD